jgi:hexosaminidase
MGKRGKYINMKKITWVILLICQFVFAANVGIIPTPQQLELSGQEFQLSAKVDYFLVGDPQNLIMGRDILSEALSDLADVSTKNIMTIILEKEENFKIDNLSAEQLSEAYSLDISPEKILIRAGTDKGLFYGLMSVTQLVKASNDASIPTLKILDYPDMTWRGISDDFSRGQVSTMENFETILRFLGEVKQNIYMPYMEDVIQLEQYPDIGAGRGALSKQDIAELQTMAKKYFVEVIPIFQTLGHYENILSDPNYMQYAEFPGAASLNSIDEKTDRFLFNMLDEVIPQFESDYFHIGCDESWDVGLGATKALVKKVGTARVHADHYNKVYDKVSSQGKKVMMYGDIILRHPEIMDMIPKDIVIVDWHYRPSDHYPSIKQFKEAGFPFLVSPGLHNWRQNIPNFINSWINISNINYEGYLNGALGSINSSWGDYGGLNFREMNYLGYAFGAESSWNPSNMDGETIKQRFLKQYFGTDCSNMELLFLVSNQIPNNTDLRYIYHNPFLPNNNNRRSGLSSSAQLIQNGELTLELIDQLDLEDIRNADKLDYFEIGARIGIITGKKTALKQKLDFYTENDYTNNITKEIRQEFINECDWLITEILDVEKVYRELWLRTNRPDNLDRLMNVMRQQAAYINKAKRSLENGVYYIDQEIPSKWISAKVYKEGKDTPPSYLRKQFEIAESAKIETAWLQVVANDAAEVYLNGQKVGRAASAKSGSLMAEKRRVAYWDVSKLLQEGSNTIAIEVQAYKPNRPSCANVYLEYTSADGKTIISSDATWQAASSVKKDWQLGRDKNGKWRKALIFEDYPKQISIPLFEEGFPSQMEL